MEQTQIPNWLDEEAKEININTNFTGERLPSLKLEQGKLTKFTVDFSSPFNKWTNEGTTKAIIPCVHNEERKNLWLNTKNPLYSQIIHAGKSGITNFTVFTTGTLANTRYEIVQN